MNGGDLEAHRKLEAMGLLAKRLRSEAAGKITISASRDEAARLCGYADWRDASRSVRLAHHDDPSPGVRALDQMRLQAKRLKRESLGEFAHSEALDAVARAHGYQHWADAKVILQGAKSL